MIVSKQGDEHQVPFSIAVILMGLPILAGCAGSNTAATDQGLSDWAGVYHRHLDVLRIDANGHFKWEVWDAPGDSGTLSRVYGAGKASYVDGEIVLRFDTVTDTAEDGKAACSDQSYRYAAIAVDNHRLLLDDTALLLYVNQVNDYAPCATNVWEFLHRVDGIKNEGKTSTGQPFPLSDLRDRLIPKNRETDPAIEQTVPLCDHLPSKYASRILKHPLEGEVMQVSPITRETFNLSHPPMPPRHKTRSSVQVTINLGSRQGTFVGMLLYIGDRRIGAEIERSEADFSIASIKWWEDESSWGGHKGPIVGTKVSSSQR